MLTYWCVLLSIVMVVGWMKLKDYVTIFSFSVKTENCKANHKWSRFAWKVCTVPPWFSQHVSKGEVPFAVTTPRLVSKYLQVNIKTFATVANWLATGGFLVKYLLFNQFHPTRATNFQEPLPASQGIHVSRASSGCITSKMVDNSWAIRKTSNRRPQEKSYRNPMFDYITFFLFSFLNLKRTLFKKRGLSGVYKPPVIDKYHMSVAHSSIFSCLSNQGHSRTGVYPISQGKCPGYTLDSSPAHCRAILWRSRLHQLLNCQLI